MRIGDDRTFLVIEATDAGDRVAPLRLYGRVETSGGTFFGSNDAVYFGNSIQAAAEISSLAQLQISSLILAMTEGCELSLERDAHGHIDVRYTIESWRVTGNARMTGSVHVDGEFAQRFLHELRALALAGPA
jgi:hypothetical protein